jgi:hypothetical protein
LTLNAVYIYVSGRSGLVFEGFRNSAFKWTLFNARLTKMRCGPLRLGRDFGRTFAHHFGVVFGLDFRLLFWPRWRDDLPVYRCFLCLGQRLGPLFRPVLDPVLDRISRHSKI